MTRIYIIEWQIFELKYLTNADVYVDETDDSWIFEANKGGAIIKSTKLKSENPEENMMFINSIAELSNITKIMAIETGDTHIEQTPDPIPTEISTEPSADGETNA
jgi:hypothetical protein